MRSDRGWRSDPSVKWALSASGGALQPWDVMLVNCPNVVCGAQNYFLDGSTRSCRRCGEFIGDRADEVYSVGVAMELEYEHLRQEALGEVDEVIGEPFDPGKSSIGFYGVPPDPDAPRDEPPAPPSRGTVALTLVWILLCIGVLAAMAVLSHYLDGQL